MNVPVEEGNREFNLLGVAVENGEEEHKFMNIEERYTLFKRKVKKQIKYLKRDIDFFFFEEIVDEICDTLTRILLTKKLRRKRKVFSNE